MRRKPQRTITDGAAEGYTRRLVVEGKQSDVSRRRVSSGSRNQGVNFSRVARVRKFKKKNVFVKKRRRNKPERLQVGYNAANGALYRIPLTEKVRSSHHLQL